MSVFPLEVKSVVEYAYAYCCERALSLVRVTVNVSIEEVPSLYVVSVRSFVILGASVGNCTVTLSTMVGADSTVGAISVAAAERDIAPKRVSAANNIANFFIKKFS